MRVLTEFLLSASDPSHFPPPTLPEVAFLGRSNVGKSSVINSLVGLKVARTSSTPGRTQAINFFEIRWAGKPKPEVLFADLPGYGYARVPRAITAKWSGFIEPYLKERQTLALCLALVDISIPPQESDQGLLNFLRDSQRRFCIVATKSDRLSNNQLVNSLRKFRQEYPEVKIVPFSARTGVGKQELWQEIRANIATNSAEEPVAED
ncbi:MAG TPA: ribosome biogenesis GTP-binding protein YihA/YsxC [Terriglobales bacterium]